VVGLDAYKTPKITIDQSGANIPAIELLQKETGHTIEIRQSKYLNNLVEQDHRAIKRIIRPMLGFKSFHTAKVTLQGIDLMHMIKKRQMITVERHILSTAEQFYALAA
jgi:putative transposase